MVKRALTATLTDQNMIKILFICHGNICRSVMAEYVMKHLCREAGMENRFEISSAAVSTEETGNDIYPPAKRKLREKDIEFDHHAARQITRADYAYYDYIICADRSNIRLLSRLIGEDTASKVSLMMAWTLSGQQAATGNIPDVSDPWYTGDFEEAYQDIYASCRAILHTCCCAPPKP